MKVLTLQPFYGGSHQAFIDGWMEQSRHHWISLTLPARHWKWRMRQAAVWFAQQITGASSSIDLSEFDCVVLTDMMNVAEFRGLLAQQGILLPPVVTYFHENQFAYPSRFPPESNAYQRDQHFAFTNLMSAIASDEVWFNSQFNADSMRQHLVETANRWPDFVPDLDSAFQNIRVHPPGIGVPAIDLPTALKRRRERAKQGQPIRLVWAARWEHDKGPDRLLAGLRKLKQRGVPFELSLLGQAYRQVPEAFTQIQDEFCDLIGHAGYVNSKSDYWQTLADSDIFVSTAIHEFFGLAAAEAIAAGNWPVLPNRLAYPELLSYVGHGFDQTLAVYESFEAPANAIEQESIAFSNLVAQLDQRRRSQPSQWGLAENQRQPFVEQLAWPRRVGAMDRDLESLRRDLIN